MILNSEDADDWDKGLEALNFLLDRILEQLEKGCNPIMVWDVPSRMVKKFEEIVVEPNYSEPGAMSKAIRDLMQQAIERQKKWNGKP